jgi:hypothetical protein
MLSTDCGKNIGCSGLNECCCLKQECCLKAGVDSIGCLLGKPVVLELMLCKLGCFCCSVGLKKPKFIAKGKSDCFCFRSNCSLPPDDDTPTMIALYGLQCYPKVGCCNKFSDAK